MEQPTLFAASIDDDDVQRLMRDMWRCIQITPFSPPALKESIRERIRMYGLDKEER